MKNKYNWKWFQAITAHTQKKIITPTTRKDLRNYMAIKTHDTTSSQQLI